MKYINAHTKVCIICPEHGEFWQEACKHKNGANCPYCTNHYTMNNIDFIKKAKVVHGNKYDYSKVEYINSNTKVCIICKEHGEFWQLPNNHIKLRGCPYCKGNIKLTTDEFIKKSRELYGDKYDYSKVEYINSNTKVCIICKEHGEFWQIPNNHLSNHGCPYCAGNVKSTNKIFIKRAKEIHGDKYDYSKVEYYNTNTKVSILCKTHGEFWLTPKLHLNGEKCPKCKQSKLESEIYNNIDNLCCEKTFDWLLYNSNMRIDFYNEVKNIAIECQGIQHFKPIFLFGGEKAYQKTLKRDKLKYELCKNHNIDVLYYFPEDFLQYNIEFYKDKKCFHNIEDLKLYINSL